MPSLHCSARLDVSSPLTRIAHKHQHEIFPSNSKTRYRKPADHFSTVFAAARGSETSPPTTKHLVTAATIRSPTVLHESCIPNKHVQVLTRSTVKTITASVLSDCTPEAVHHERQVQHVDGVLADGTRERSAPRLGLCSIHVSLS